MTDEELIANWEDEPPDFPDEFKESYVRLIALARIGAAVKAKEPTAFDTLPDDYEVI